MASEKACRADKLNPKAYEGTPRGEVCLQHKESFQRNLFKTNFCIYLGENCTPLMFLTFLCVLREIFCAIMQRFPLLICFIYEDLKKNL